ncbi:MAG: hypothetical protein COZ17_11505 [Flavobacteriaceae bacterium CG_4_10_14_3_um_filter_33_47]|nr:MAG: hypothetical protein COZ17_11505 [Flavobacteriaceae bacterium CG_4_10_14_3_um_filter_33_47]PJB18190.1 MAG: hypothetical protein CO117_08895 [Flavobacteriaceae bacterium CG_4_9_14_3_um_filter_33_16]
MVGLTKNHNLLLFDFTKTIKDDKKPIKKHKLFFIGFLICMLGIFFSTILQNIIDKFIDPNFTNFDRLDYPINLHFFFKIVLLGPILEELGFRLFLKPRKRVYIPISFAICSFYILGFLFRDLNIYYKLSLSIFSFGLTYFYSNNIKQIIEDYYSCSFYLTAFIFSFLHLKTFNSISQIQWVFFLIVILPYFFYAIAFSYVRIKSNTFLAILLHAAINGIAFFIKYIVVLW